MASDAPLPPLEAVARFSQPGARMNARLDIDPERALAEGLASGEIVTLSLEAIDARRVLELLAEGASSHRVRVSSEDVEITVEIGNGLVVGAEARHDGKALAGPDAYSLMRKLHRGSIRVEPLRFPSLANILEPVAELSDLIQPSSLPPAIGPDTIELSIPEARPVHVAPPTGAPAPTEEIELPPELMDRWSSAPPPPPSEPTPEIASAPAVTAPSTEVTQPATAVMLPPPASSEELEAVERPVQAGRARSRRGRVWAAAAALLLIGGGIATYTALDGAPSPSPADGAPQLAGAAPAEEAVDDADDGDAEAEEDEARADTAARRASRARARRLAREARRLLRQGNARQALPRARRAARLRGHLPYYQVVLGDALAANGRRAAARRAYRRALRMRPEYEPALQRLGRQRSELASRGSRTERG